MGSVSGFLLLWAIASASASGAASASVGGLWLLLEQLWLEVAFFPEWYVWGTLGSLLGAAAAWFYYSQFTGTISSRRLAVDAAEAEAELRNEVAQARRTLEDHKASKIKLERDLSTALERGAAQRDALNECKEQLVAAQSSGALTALHAELETASHELQALKAALFEASTKASRYESLLHGLEERAEAQQGELRQQVSVLELSVCDLKAACATRERNLDAAGAKLAAATTRISMLEAERSVHSEWQEREASGNLTELIEATATISQLAPRCELLQQENKALLAETRRLESLLLAGKEECAANEVEKRAAVNETHRLRAQLLEKSRAIADSHDNFTTLSNRCADLERRLIQRTKSAKAGDERGEGNSNEDKEGGGGGVVDVMGILSSPMRPVSDLFSSLLGGGGGAGTEDSSSSAAHDLFPATPTKLTKDALHHTHSKLRKTPSKAEMGAGGGQPSMGAGGGQPSHGKAAGVLGNKIHEIRDRGGGGQGRRNNAPTEMIVE